MYISGGRGSSEYYCYCYYYYYYYYSYYSALRRGWGGAATPQKSYIP